jgi:hypothetical protein
LKPLTIIIAALLGTLQLPLGAQSRTEKELTTRLAATETELAQAAKERAALAASVARLTASIAKLTTATSETSAQSAARAAREDTMGSAQEAARTTAAESARQAAAIAAAVAAVSATRDGDAASRGTTLTVVTIGGIFTTLMTFAFKAYTDKRANEFKATTDARDRLWAREDADRKHADALTALAEVARVNAASKDAVLAAVDAGTKESSQAIRISNNFNQKLVNIGESVKDAVSATTRATAIAMSHSEANTKSVLEAVAQGSASSAMAIEHANSLTQKVIDMREDAAKSVTAVTAALDAKVDKSKAEGVS